MIINNLPYYILRSLILTVIIEAAAGFVIGIRRGKDFLNILLVNMITNPVVTILPVLINIRYGTMYRSITLYVLEIAVFAAEALIYKKVLEYKKINYFVISLILNACSFGIGEIINRLF